MNCYTNISFSNLNFLEGFAIAKLRHDLQKNLRLFKENQLGVDFFNGNYNFISGYLDCLKTELTKEDFEYLYKNEIEKTYNSLINHFVVEDNRKNTNFIIERNKYNNNLKHIPTYFQAKYNNLFYIYNAGIHQIVRIYQKQYFFHLIIQLPSGRLHGFNIKKEDFFNKKFFVSKKLAQDYLNDFWIKENKIPIYRKKDFL